MTELYRKDASGNIRVWSIRSVWDGLEIEYGTLNGLMQYQREEILEGKAGRDVDEQIESRIESRINSKLDQGYVKTIEEARKGLKNKLGYKKPMLAQKITDFNINRLDLKNACLQKKYDGHRCLVVNNGGENIAYTRNGKVIDTISHITKELKIPEGITLDGELYCHGLPLQSISSLVKRQQLDTIKLQYHIYDAIIDDTFRNRMGEILKMGPSIVCRFVQTKFMQNIDQIFAEAKDYVRNGYEGAILRLDNASYEDGKRSKSLLKIKEFQDSEFKVIDIEESKDGWAILVLETDIGRAFRVSAPGTMQNKTEIFANKHRYIGKYITVQYSQLTKDKIPFHPVAVKWADEF